MEKTVTITEDQALGEGKDIQQLLLDYYRKGYVIYHATTHPAVGQVITLVTLDYFADKLVYAIKNRDSAVANADSTGSHEMQA